MNDGCNLQNALVVGEHSCSFTSMQCFRWFIDASQCFTQFALLCCFRTGIESSI